MILDREDIERRIPHREPFIFLDRITDFEEGKRAVGWLDNPLEVIKRFGDPWAKLGIMPPTIWAEALAEVLCVVGGLPEGKIGVLTGLEGWKFRYRDLNGPVSLEIKVGRIRTNFGNGYGWAKVNNELLSKGKLSFGIVDFAELQQSKDI